MAGLPSGESPAIAPDARSRSRGIAHDFSIRVFLAQFAQGILQLVIRKAVAFGGHDDEWALLGAQEIEQAAVAFLLGNADIHERKAQREALALLQIRLDKAGPFSEISRGTRAYP